MRYDIPREKIEEQIKREEAQREAALGRRFAAASDGFLGPVISRWINASVSPIACRLRQAATAYNHGDLHTFGRLLDTPTFGLAAAYDGGSPEYLDPILKWVLKGQSPGRSGEGCTYAEDLVLSVVGKTISDLAMRSLSNHGKAALSEDVPGLGLAMILSNAAGSARETALGQFITMVQGASAMEKVRRKDRSSWAQRDKMRKVAGMLSSQVKQALEMEAKGEISLEHVGSRTIVKVIDTRKGEFVERRISLKADDLDREDWALLQLAVVPKGAQDDAKNAWITFAMMVLCAAQVEHGWFDLVKAHSEKNAKSRKPKGRGRFLILAEQPRHHLKADLAKWISMGFAFDPMVVPPQEGYLTVKTKAVTGRNGPHGWKTSGEGTTAWEIAQEVMGATPWQVAKGTLDEINSGGYLLDRIQTEVPDELTRRLILGAYSRDSYQEHLYLPLYMDFRGRLYPRTSWVSYQGNDLQKGLLRFPPSQAQPDPKALALHVSGLMGFDKAPLKERLEVVQNLGGRKDFDAWCTKAEDPVQLWTALDLIDRGLGDQVPVQIDGTCNGLQHLSALFRDADAAPWVNLSPSSYDDKPSDLYSEVAGNSQATMVLLAAAGEAWAMRLQSAGVTITRATVKRPVMVLPYGGTMIAIEEGVTDGVLGQDPPARYWKECLKTNGELDPEALKGGYLAFADRPLAEHPLFRRDMQKLGQVVYKAIKATIPKAMEAMDAFRAIAGKVGDRSLEWSNGIAPNPMWIVHAYPKTVRRTAIFRGFHLPNSVRGLAMKCGRDEVYAPMHRTGIVANFIHSQDAAHLVATMEGLHAGCSFGANHDCLYGRSSEIGVIGVNVRGAFARRYMGDPLKSPVRLRSSGEDGKVETFDSWYGLAKEFGVEFPEMGRWDPRDVLQSAWFFS